MKEDFAKARDRLKAIFANGFENQWAKVEEAFDKVDADFNSVSDANLSFIEKIQKSRNLFRNAGNSFRNFLRGSKGYRFGGGRDGQRGHEPA